VSSANSFESEESFGLRPETMDADRSTSRDNNLSAAIHTPYLAGNKVFALCPYYPDLDIKVPDWVSSQTYMPSYSGVLDYGPGSTFTNDPSLVFADSSQSLSECWPELVSPDFGGLDHHHLQSTEPSM